MAENPFYNVQHSPIGAFASFTLGFPGKSGGLGLELDKPADENVYIALEKKDSADNYNALPFFEGIRGGDMENYTLGQEKKENPRMQQFESWSAKQVKRTLTCGADVFEAGDLTFSVYSPAQEVPDPETASDDALKFALIPAVFIEARIDNKEGKKERNFIFGYEPRDSNCRLRTLQDTVPELPGFANGNRTAIITDYQDAAVGLSHDLKSILDAATPSQLCCGIGKTAILMMKAPAGKITTFRFAVCFYSGGIVTARVPASYFYTRFFDGLESVGKYALEYFDKYKQAALDCDKPVAESKMNEPAKWMLRHAVHSYYGSTELLDVDGKPFWVVNEGGYVMMNTLDLTVDQVFYELDKNPWTVRNELDWFADRFSYTDQVQFPEDKTLYPGGISFTHDMGIGNTISLPGYSTYERSGMKGCGSYMTCEELYNWILCAFLYLHKTGDNDWVERNSETLKACFESMLNRDNPDPEKRNGIMGLDSSRCQGGIEITTYDSLDPSLGQARNNTYMAVKGWSAYLAFEQWFLSIGDTELAETARKQACSIARILEKNISSDGRLPAILFEGIGSPIIPCIEGLVYAEQLGMKQAVSESGEFGSMITVLKNHLRTVLNSGECLFDDGGWKLSSGSVNSWLSKIYLCQYVTESILEMEDEFPVVTADTAHANWLHHPKMSYWAWTDQCINCVPTGSKYYPRGVTSWLRLDKS